MTTPIQEAVMKVAARKYVDGGKRIKSTESFAEGWNAALDWLLQRTHDAHLRVQLREAMSP